MLGVGLGGAASAADDLGVLRAERRQAVRQQALAKADGGAPFGLLVIPVDFADQRLASPPDLGPRLDADQPGSLAHYVDVASQGRTRLQIRLAPLISLAGNRLDYSDRYLQGFTRTRALAAEAIAGALAAGVVLADSDADGDGEVDGVLLLHAAPGLENDPDGLIMPLQYFLADPVVQHGITARMYAVGAARSGLGLWAHEVAHLLGLEERYDVMLPATSEATPRGGLGRFSLMAAGWRGSGEGHDPALPDAYSRLQLGWVDLATDLGGGVVRVSGASTGDGEYFLVERRDGTTTAPYDAGLDADRALVLRVRETMPEGVVQTDDPWRRQRVQLVEADGLADLALGLSDGDLDDLFPTAGDQQRFNDQTVPSSRFEPGDVTEVDLLVTTDGGLARLDNLAGQFPVQVAVSFPPGGASGEMTVSARVERGPAFPERIVVEVTILPPSWGHFLDGLGETVVELVPTDEPGWANYMPEEPVHWVQSAAVPDGSVSTLVITLLDGGTGAQFLAYPWFPDHARLALDDDGWDQHWFRWSDPPDHRWRRWSAVPDWPEGFGPVAYCVASEPDQEPRWPDVSYGNNATSSLTSSPLGLDIRWVRFTHALDVEMLRPGVSVDAATLVWHGPTGEVPARPADGWAGHCDPRSGHPLAGADGFVTADTLLADAVPIWRTEVVPVPDPAVHGPGPWSLGFEFASNALWRGRGWLVRDIHGSTGPPPASAFALWTDGQTLHWTAPVGADPAAYVVQVRQGDQGPWRPVADIPSTEHRLPLADLGVPPGEVAFARVLAMAGHPVASRPVLVAGRAGTPTLLAAQPNPARSSLTFAYDGGGDPRARVSAYDLRGRLVRTWPVGDQAGRLAWDGTDKDGRRLAAGVYILRLEANGRTRTTKVTWLH
jgi:M6 family metalloprotease-like protein